MSTQPAPDRDEPETTGWDPLLPDGRPYQPGAELAASLKAGHTESLKAFEERGTDRHFLRARTARHAFKNRNRGNQ